MKLKNYLFIVTPDQSQLIIAILILLTYPLSLIEVGLNVRLKTELLPPQIPKQGGLNEQAYFIAHYIDLM